MSNGDVWLARWRYGVALTPPLTATPTRSGGEALWGRRRGTWRAPAWASSTAGPSVLFCGRGGAGLSRSARCSCRTHRSRRPSYGTAPVLILSLGINCDASPEPVSSLQSPVTSLHTPVTWQRLRVCVYTAVRDRDRPTHTPCGAHCSTPSRVIIRRKG